MKLFLVMSLLLTSFLSYSAHPWIIEDIVERARPLSDGLEVRFENHSGIYFLSKKNKNFSKFKSMIEKSQKDHLQLEVVSNASTLDIESIVNK